MLFSLQPNLFKHLELSPVEFCDVGLLQVIFQQYLYNVADQYSTSTVCMKKWLEGRLLENRLSLLQAANRVYFEMKCFFKCCFIQVLSESRHQKLLGSASLAKGPATPSKRNNPGSHLRQPNTSTPSKLPPQTPSRWQTPSKPVFHM